MKLYFGGLIKEGLRCTNCETNWESGMLLEDQSLSSEGRMGAKIEATGGASPLSPQE